MANKNSKLLSGKESQKLFKELFNQSNDAFFVIDPETSYFLEVNDTACDSLGYEREELLGLGVINIDTKLPNPSAWKEHIKELRKKKTEFFQGEHKRKSGSTFPVEVSVKYTEQSGKDYIVAVARNISERQKNKEEIHSKNIAMHEIINQIEMEKQTLIEQVQANVQNVILPAIEKLRVQNPSIDENHFFTIEKNLKDLTSSFGAKISKTMFKLTPKEIAICDMIKNGLSTKEIAQTLSISSRTVEVHRNDIRRKLGLAHEKVNLASYLKSL